MNYTSLLKKFTPLLDRFEVELLLSHVTHRPREFFIAHPEFTPSLLEYLRFKRALQKRLSGVPIAYITGTKEFYGLEFEVNKHTLIPRPDTEIMVEAVKLQITNYKLQHITLIDVGTGSGCIPISIMKAIKHENMKAFATDISEGALRVAKRNAKKHQADIQFCHGNLLQPLIDNKTMKQWINETIIITANLPYLTEQQFTEEPSIQHEPKSALVADDQGLALYKELLLQIKNTLSEHSLIGFFEIDPAQTDKISSIINAMLPHAHITIIKDFSNNDRCVKFSLN